VNIEGSNFLIIGILDSEGTGGFSMNGTAYFPFPTYTSLIDHSDSLTSIVVRANDAESIAVIKPFISAILHTRRDQPVSEDLFEISDLTALTETAAQITSTFTMLLAAVASISLVVGGIGIMNMMLTTVTERTREIGLRKALGARRRDISFQFLMESMLLTFLGGVFGIAIGVSSSLLLNRIMPFETQITFGSVLFATLFSVMIGVFFGYYPAQKAARLNPIEALRHE
jgi:ABC-type antimicrobial peptide transport system permease subunit